MGPQNLLYYGDNLEILRHHIKDESVDLIYLDPPFNSNADYNVLFAEKTGERAHAQIKAFEDTWTWDSEAAEEYAQVVQSGHERVAKCVQGMYAFLGGSDMMAYLSMMALRLTERPSVLDWTSSPDMIFADDRPRRQYQCTHGKGHLHARRGCSVCSFACADCEPMDVW